LPISAKGKSTLNNAHQTTATVLPMTAHTAKQQTPFRVAKALLPGMDSTQIDKLKLAIIAEETKRKASSLKIVRTKCDKLASEAGFTVEEVLSSGARLKPKKPAKQPKTASAPKYANPADKSKTWTGKGRRPDWYKMFIAAGTTREAMAIKKS
jgi:DNA-binding protein H-NS